MKITLSNWTMEDALEFIRDNQFKFWDINYHLALAGSVLNTGNSANDLDIIVMGTHNENKTDPEELKKLLETQFKARQLTDECYIMQGRILYRSIYETKTIDWFCYDIGGEKE